MRIALLFVGIVVLCMPCWLSPITRRIDTHECVRVCVTAVALGAVLVELSMLLFAAPAVLGEVRNAPFPTLGAWFGAVTPVRLQLSWVAAALAVLFPLLGQRGWVRATAASEDLRVEPSFGVHRRVDGIDVVRVPIERLVAYSIDGRHPQIVVSDGLASLLATNEFDVVVQHEVTHIRERHGRILRFLAALETPIPPVRAIAGPVRVAMERRADEAAVGQDPSRRAALLDALLKVTGERPPAVVAAFNDHSGIVERAEALLAAPPPLTRIEHLRVHLALGGTVVGAIVAAGGGAFAVHLMLSMAGLCCL